MTEVEVETASANAKLLLCRCRGHSLHHGAVRVLGPQELEIGFFCADCRAPDLTLTITQRKGSTFLAWREVKP